MILNAWLQFIFDSLAGTYTIYFSLLCSGSFACLVHGSDRFVLQFEPTYQFSSNMLTIAEGDTLELHVPDSVFGYHRAIYTASGGDIVATLEKDVNTNISNVTPE